MGILFGSLIKPVNSDSNLSFKDNLFLMVRKNNAKLNE